ncbi:MAG TPA: hypothetical protein VI318_03835 [Baekduia sp.]
MWQAKLGLIATLTVATALAILSGYHVSPGVPPKLKARAIPTGAATAQVLVDSPSSALANLKQNPIPLSTRAGVFAQFMASTAIRDAIAARTGFPANTILAQGPFDDPAMAPEGPKPPDPASVAAGKKYRLTFVAQEQLPVVTVYAQAPDVASAQRLADAVAPSVQGYVDELQAKADLNEKYRTQIRGLGPAQAGTVKASPNIKVIGTFLLVTILGLLSILQVSRWRRRRRERRALRAAELSQVPVVTTNGDTVPSFAERRERSGDGHDIVLTK